MNPLRSPPPSNIERFLTPLKDKFGMLGLVWFKRIYFFVLMGYVLVTFSGRSFTVTKIMQERTKIGPFFDFILHFSTFVLEILNIALQLSCEAM